MDLRKKSFVLVAVLALLALTMVSRLPAHGSGVIRPVAMNVQDAPTAVYQLDPAHSTIGFAVRHLMINNVTGRFKDFSGKINYDAADITRSSVDFIAKVTSVDTGVVPRDNHLRTPDFFDVQQYPEMSFKSSKVERKGKEAYVAHGVFTLHGIAPP